MLKDIDRYVQECDSCKQRRNKREFRAPKGKVHHPNYASQYTHMDVIVLFPRSTNGNRYLLTLADELTKFMEAIQLAEISAQTCARAYDTGIVDSH
jgi:hypothetical protein